jgi:hypothetical protein
MKKVTLEVELHPELAELLEKLIEETPSYVSGILNQHLSRKKIYHGIETRKDESE